MPKFKKNTLIFIVAAILILILTENRHFSGMFLCLNVLSTSYLQNYTNKQDVRDFSRGYMSITITISEMSIFVAAAILFCDFDGFRTFSQEVSMSRSMRIVITYKIIPRNLICEIFLRNIFFLDIAHSLWLLVTCITQYWPLATGTI